MNLRQLWAGLYTFMFEYVCMFEQINKFLVGLGKNVMFIKK